MCGIFWLMPLSRDPETLRVPAFMRKRRIKAGAGKPLILTALDRKNESKKLKAKVRKQAKIKKARLGMAPKHRPEPKVETTSAHIATGRISRRQTKPKTASTFSPPLMDFFSKSTFEEPKAPPQKTPKVIGEVTHYYNKIQVAVIKLKGILNVGDLITYDTTDGDYQEIVESMEIDRKPVFKAGKGKEIGIKLRREPKIGSTVSL
jgi:putative protease